MTQIKKIEIESFVVSFRRGRRRNNGTSREEMGWINYFRLAEVEGIFDELDGS
jgi:hypothetical protein